MQLAERITQCLSSACEVITGSDALLAYQQNCEAQATATSLVVKVATEQDIRQLLQLASQLRHTDDAFVIFPISTGKNWGYNSATPNSPAVLLDLSGLRQIRVIDATLGLFAVQPGVTQQLLRDFLDQQQLAFMVPVTGAGPDCSILGNALERGYGITPYTDHFGAVTAMRAMLADGSIVQSAVAELDQSQEGLIDHTYKYGVGPYLDGLWTQSNLAIVTEITVRLKANPAAFDAFYIQFQDDQQFELAQQIVFQILRDLEGVVGSVNIMDRRRVAAMMAVNPNGAAAHQVMTEQQVSDIAKAYDIPAWTIAGTLYGRPKVVAAAKAEVKSIIGGRANKVLFSSSALIKIGRLAVKLLPALLAKPAKMLASLDAGIQIMRGVPNQVALPLAYWRNPRVEPAASVRLNPAADQCGLLWYAPLVPMRAEAMRAFIQHIRTLCPKYGIEPMITFTSLRHDTVDSTIPIVFNRLDPDAVAQAKACLDELVKVGLKQGWVPYRLNLQQQAELLHADSTFWQVVQRIKQALDPEALLSPGRYCPKP
ncbi:FAD-binding protein [Alishewanella aestuarii B11]|uniref:FAD-binding protein n=1 Tax=Alishewanella aestuarii B11 TaxID=1197174 RepID=J2IBZ8_9ALTE|nr:FAD-binding oxidoreductase [Alishewanella aestuarii]EJI84194.1 FAD-binding protein [Alishewanella aestuarii B11]